MKNIAFFDFDGTITTKDSMLDLAQFHAGPTIFLLKMGMLSPMLLLMKAKLISNDLVKQIFLKQFFGGMNEEEFSKLCLSYSTKRLPTLIRPQALEEIKKYKAEGTAVVVVSASANHWLRYWCHEQNLLLISSKLEVIDGKITGRLNGPNCNGKQKALNIRQAFDLAAYEKIYAYGDSSGDKEMFEISTTHYFKPFR